MRKKMVWENKFKRMLYQQMPELTWVVSNPRSLIWVVTHPRSLIWIIIHPRQL
jgi:hypothetical protein